MAKQNKTSGRRLLLLLAVIAAALCAAAVLLDPLDMFGGSDLPEAKKPSSESSQQFSDPVQAEGVSVQVPILLYHHISEDTLTQEQFQTEMQLLKDGGYHTVSFDQRWGIRSTIRIRNSPSPLITVMNRQRRCRIPGLSLFKATPSICTSGLPMSRATGCGTTFCAGKMKRRKNIPKPLQLIFPNPGKSLKPPPESR